MSYKLAAFDLDGTLLNSNHQISSRSEKMLRDLYLKGVHIVIATGRPYTVVRRLLKKLSIFQGPDAIKLSTKNKTRWLVASDNGATIHDEELNCLFSEEINPVFCESLYKVAKDDPKVNLNVFLSCTSEDRANPNFVNNSDRDGDPASDLWYCQRYDPKEAAVHADAGLRPQVEPDIRSKLRTKGVKELFFLCYDEKAGEDLVREINECVSTVGQKTNSTPNIKVTPSSPTCFDVVPFGMSKASALEFITKYLNVSLSECVAFGDGMNDGDMLRSVGKPFVMQNGDPALKKYVPQAEVIGYNYDDAVAATVERVFSL